MKITSRLSSHQRKLVKKNTACHNVGTHIVCSRSFYMDEGEVHQVCVFTVDGFLKRKFLLLHREQQRYLSKRTDRQEDMREDGGREGGREDGGRERKLTIEIIMMQSLWHAYPSIEREHQYLIPTTTTTTTCL